MSKHKVTVEIWSDVVCPYCLVGKKKLEQAIAKIDKETKARFKKTFDTVNEHLNNLFPKILPKVDIIFYINTSAENIYKRKN